MGLKKALLVGALACSIGAAGVGAITTSANSPFGFVSTNDVLVTADSWFTPNVKATKSDQNTWGVMEGKQVEQSWVRIVEGDYDSGRVNSHLATSKSDSTTYHAYESKFNAPFSTAYTSYGFYYFK